MSEYLDYDEAVRANRARKKKAMAMKRKRQDTDKTYQEKFICSYITVSNIGCCHQVS